MNTVVALLLLFTFNSLNDDGNRQLAYYILNHLHDVSKMSMNELSLACHTSTTSINKFCRILGYASFKKFKTMIESTMEARMKQIHTRYQYNSEEKIYQQIQALYNKKIDVAYLEEETNRVVEMIAEANSIYLVGSVYPLALTMNFIEDMYVFDKHVYFEQLNLMDVTAYKDPKTLMIMISVTGRIIIMDQERYSRLTANQQVKKSVDFTKETTSVIRCFYPITR